MDKEITQFSDFIQLSKADLIMEIIPKLSAYDEKGDLFQKPSTARDIGLIILHVTDHYHHMCLKSEKPFDKQGIKDFVFCMKHGMELVNKLVAESFTDRDIKIGGQVQLPRTEDI